MAFCGQRNGWNVTVFSLKPKPQLGGTEMDLNRDFMFNQHQSNINVVGRNINKVKKQNKSNFAAPLPLNASELVILEEEKQG